MIWVVAGFRCIEIPRLTQKIGSLDQHTGVIGNPSHQSPDLRLSSERNLASLNQSKTKLASVAFVQFDVAI